MSDDIATITNSGQPQAAPAAAPVVNADVSDVAIIRENEPDEKKLPKNAIENDDGSITWPMFVPVVLRWRATSNGDVTEDAPVTEIAFRRLTGKDVRVIMNAGEGNAFWNELTAASVRTQFPNKQKWLNVLDRMDGADSAACFKIAQYFLENGPRTPGPNSSHP